MRIFQETGDLEKYLDLRLASQQRSECRNRFRPWVRLQFSGMKKV
jgi:hypothetical protein